MKTDGSVLFVGKGGVYEHKNGETKKLGAPPEPPVAACPICAGNDLGCTWGLTLEEARRDRAGWK